MVNNKFRRIDFGAGVYPLTKLNIYAVFPKEMHKTNQNFKLISNFARTKRGVRQHTPYYIANESRIIHSYTICESRCIYCGFYSTTAKTGAHATWTHS